MQCRSILEFAASSRSCLIYSGLRTLIIIFSTIVAAGVGGSRFHAVSAYTPSIAILLIAILASILTNLDSWLKPGEIYQAHFRFNTYYLFQEFKLALISPTDKAALAQFASDLENVDKQYLEATREKK